MLEHQIVPADAATAWVNTPVKTRGQMLPSGVCRLNVTQGRGDELRLDRTADLVVREGGKFPAQEADEPEERGRYSPPVTSASASPVSPATL
jgi:hypothetical protein